jgi:hypothetical protein
MVRRFDRKANDRKVEKQKIKMGAELWRVKDAEEVQAIFAVIRKFSTLKKIAEFTIMDVDAAKEALSKKGEAVSTYKATGGPKWVGVLLNDWLNLRREIAMYKFGAPNDEIGLSEKESMGDRYRDLIFKNYGETYVAIGKVPAEIFQKWTPARHKVVLQFVEDNPEWTGFDKWDRKRIEVESVDRTEKKRLKDEEEDSILKFENRLESEKMRVKKFKELLKTAEELYKTAKSLEEKEQAEQRCVNIKMSLMESEKLVKVREKELKERKKHGD